MRKPLSWMLLLSFLVASFAAIDSALKTRGDEVRQAQGQAIAAQKAFVRGDLETARDLLQELRNELGLRAPAALSFEELRLGLLSQEPTLVNAALERIESFGLVAGLWPFAASWFASAQAADELARAGDAASTEEELRAALAAARAAFDAASAAVLEGPEDWPEAGRNAERLFLRLRAVEARIPADPPEEEAPKLPPPQKENEQPQNTGAEEAEAPMPLPGKTRLLTPAEIAVLQKRLEAKEGQKRALREKVQRGSATGEDW